MKNRFLLLTAVCAVIGGSVFAQSVQNATFTSEGQADFLKRETNAGLRYNGANPLLNVSLGDTLWYSDFSDANDWSFTNQGSLGWDIVTTATVWFYDGNQALTSTSGGEFAEMNNGDPTATTTTAATHIMQSAQISVTGATGPAFLMWQERSSRFFDQMLVQVSSNGTAWQTIGRQEHLLPRTAANNTPGSLTNPEYVGYYVPASVMTATGNLWVRFYWTDDNNGVAYGWQIDDVVLYTGPTNDLSLDRAYMYGATDSAAYQKYTRIPEIQAEEASFRPAGLVIGNGSATQSDVVISVSESNTGYSSTSTAISLANDEFAIVEVADDFTTDGTGNYSMTYSVASGNTDMLSENNEMDWDFTVTDNIFAYDKDDNQGSGWWGSSGYTFCLYYDNFAADTVVGVQGYFPLIGTTTQYGLKYGQTLKATLYEDDGTGNLVELGSGGFYDVAGGTSGNFVDDWITVPANIPVPATVEFYYACITTYENEIPLAYDYGVGGYGLVDSDNSGSWGNPITTPYDTFNVLPYLRVKTKNAQLCANTTIAVIGEVDDANETFTASIELINVSGGQSPYTFSWSGPTGFSGASTQDLEGLTIKGDYTVTVTDNNGCSEVQVFTVDGNLAVEDVEVSNLKVYPNPASEFVNVELANGGSYDVIITSVKGDVVMRSTMNASTGINTVDVSELASGSYIIKMTDESNAVSISEFVIR